MKKNNYIVAIKDQKTLEPHLLTIPFWNDITRIGQRFYRAYIFESKKQAEDVWKDRYKTYTERQK